MRKETDQADHGAGEAGRQGTGDDGTGAQGRDLGTALGHHGAHAADEDAQAAEIGEAAQGVGHDEPRPLAQGTLGQGRQFNIGQKLVQDGLDAHEAAGRYRLARGNAHQPGQGGQDPAQQALEADRLASQGRQ